MYLHQTYRCGRRQRVGRARPQRRTGGGRSRPGVLPQPGNRGPAAGAGVKVAVAMSGGVDSSVAAAMMRDEGQEIFGVTRQLWPKEMAARDFDKNPGCCSVDEVEDGRPAGKRLGTHYHVL